MEKSPCSDCCARNINYWRAFIEKGDFYDVIPILSTLVNLVVLGRKTLHLIGSLFGSWDDDPRRYGPSLSYCYNKSIIVACVALLPVIGNIILAVGRYFTDSFTKEKKKALEDISKGVFDIRKASPGLINDEKAMLSYLQHRNRKNKGKIQAIGVGGEIEIGGEVDFIGLWLLRNSRKVVLLLAEKCPLLYHRLRFLSSPFIKDKEVVKKILTTNASMITSMDPEILADFSIVSDVFKKNPKILDLDCFPPHTVELGLQEERKKALREIQQGAFSIANSSERLREDLVTMTAFLEKGGSVLFLRGKLVQNETLALLAVRRKRYNYLKLPKELQKREHIALAAIDSILEANAIAYPDVMKELKIPSTLFSSKGFFQKCMKRDPLLICYFPQFYKDDKPSLDYALDHGGVPFFKQLPEVMQSNEALALRVASKWPKVASLLPKTLQTKEFLSKVIKKNPLAFRWLPPEWENNEDLAKLAFGLDKRLWPFLPAAMQRDLWNREDLSWLLFSEEESRGDSKQNTRVKNDASLLTALGKESQGNSGQNTTEENDVSRFINLKAKEYVSNRFSGISEEEKNFRVRVLCNPLSIFKFPEFLQYDLPAFEYALEHFDYGIDLPYGFFRDTNLGEKTAEYVRTAIRTNPGVAAYLPKELENEDFLLRIVRKNPFVFRFLQLEQQKNPEIAAAAALEDRRVLPFVPREIKEEVEKILNNS